MKKLSQLKAWLRRIFHRPQKIPKGAHLEPIHHYHVRKRVHHWFEEYPHPDKLKRLIDRSVYVVGVIGPIMTLPQLYAVWGEKNTSGVAISTWSAYVVIALFWLSYGVLHREKPIMVTYSSWLVIHLAMVLGIIIHN